MAVSVVLDWDEIRSILSLYHLEGLEAFGPLKARSSAVRYWVRVAGKRYMLRVAAGRCFSDMVFEKDLMQHLVAAGMCVPQVIENVASGAFTPWQIRGRYVSLFEDLAGRELGVFELRAKQVRAVATFLGGMHRVAVEFYGHRRNEHDIDALELRCARLSTALERRRLARRHRDDVAMIVDELEVQRKRRTTGTEGVIHGRLFVDSARFNGDRLSAVIGFEHACRERLTWDVAVAMNAWCWEPSIRQQGGPAGRMGRKKCRAFLSAYTDVRTIEDVEREELYFDLRLVAARFALARLTDHELRRVQEDRAGYEDYRHFTARLRCLREADPSALIS